MGPTVEVVQKDSSTATNAAVAEAVLALLERESIEVADEGPLDEALLSRCPFVREHVEAIYSAPGGPSASASAVVYRLERHRGAPDGEEEAAVRWRLPHREFAGLWESLVFDTDVKEHTLRLTTAALELADLGANPRLVSLNRLALLHGPPGTGKTSLCRALAQKLAARLRGRYPRAELVEIDSHGLFSKWFSESGKLVRKLFDAVAESAEDSGRLVCVLVDEVESLVRARSAAVSGCEPSDSIRVVNAVLTQLDRLKAYPNALVLTTSNETAAVDLAFADRADVKRYVGPPSKAAIFRIYRSCLEELARIGAVVPAPDLGPDADAGRELLRLAEASAGLSGRALRKVPVLAFARLSPTERDPGSFLRAMEEALNEHLFEGQTFCKSGPR